MATNLALNDGLIAEALRLGKHKSKREAVNAALEEYVRHRQQLVIKESFGKYEFDQKYDYKAERKKDK